MLGTLSMFCGRASRGFDAAGRGRGGLLPGCKPRSAGRGRAARAFDGLALPRKASRCPRRGLRCDFGAVGCLPVFEMAQASWSGQLSSSSVVCGRNRANARAKAASRSVFVGGSAIGLIVSCKTARARSSHSSSCSSLNVCPARSSAHSHQSARIRSRCSSAMDHCKPRH